MELKEKVKTLIADVDKTHRYSMSRIYGLYNEVFNKSEAPQSCASCLIRKVKSLRVWLDEQNAETVQPVSEKKRRSKKAVTK